MLGTPWDTATSGRDLTYGLGWFTIAGVVGDVRGDSVVADPGLDFYVPVYPFFAGMRFSCCAPPMILRL